MGNYLFERNLGEPGTGIGTGYVSPGHNSVYYDEQTEEQYLIFHTRFPERGEEHEIRVHQMFMNDDGWPVDRKSTRLNSSHVAISYAVFCLKEKKRRHV